MVGSPIPPTMQAFLDDLIAVREDRGMTRDALQQATKINLSLIEQFEHTALLDHPLFNQVYQRAILRSYARTIRIDEALLFQSFEAAISGVYRRELAVALLGLPPLPETQSPAVPDATRASEVASELASDSATALASPGRGRSAPPRGVHAKAGAPSRPFARPPIPALTSGFKQVVSQVVRAVRAALLAIFDKTGVRGLAQWGGILAAIVIGLTLLIQFIQRPSREDDGTNQAAMPEAAARMDSSGEFAEPAPPVMVTLNDSLSLMVVARRNKLDPFRVQVDRDLRRPYWLDQGDTLQFAFANRITVEDRLEDMTVLLEGHPYPLVPADTSGRVVIDRDSVILFLAERRDTRP